MKKKIGNAGGIFDVGGMGGKKPKKMNAVKNVSYGISGNVGGNSKYGKDMSKFTGGSSANTSESFWKKVI